MDIDELISEFSDESADRCWIVEQLADCADDRVSVLFASTLENLDDDDLVRIEILKSLVLRSDTEPHRGRIAKAVRRTLDEDEDDVVRQHAAKALRGFIDVEGTLPALETIVANEDEDIDVRHNALTALESNCSLESCREALQRLTVVPELGRSAQRILEEHTM